MLSLKSVLLDNSLPCGGESYLFENPREVVVAHAPAEVDDALARITGGLKEGAFAAGYFSYELGYLLEQKLTPLLPQSRAYPLIWAGLFDDREVLQEADVLARLGAGQNGGYEIDDLRLSMTRDAYYEVFDAVQDYIAAGDVYQINLTLKYLFQLNGDPLALYRALRRKQNVAYGAVIRASAFDVLSLSPELFFAL